MIYQAILRVEYETVNLEKAANKATELMHLTQREPGIETTIDEIIEIEEV